MYKDQNVLFLMDESDTVKAYETRGMDKKTPTTKQDQERKILQGMNHTQQIEMIQGDLSLLNMIYCTFLTLILLNYNC